MHCEWHVIYDTSRASKFLLGVFVKRWRVPLLNFYGMIIVAHQCIDTCSSKQNAYYFSKAISKAPFFRLISVSRVKLFRPIDNRENYFLIFNLAVTRSTWPNLILTSTPLVHSFRKSLEMSMRSRSAGLIDNR